MRKKIIKFFLLLSTFLFASCSTSQNDAQWSSLSYIYETGPLPPKYQYTYTITLNTKCEGGIVAYVGLDNSNTFNYEFKFSKDSLAILNNAIKDSKILVEEIEKLPEEKQPIGGHLEKVRVVLVNPNPNLDQPPRVKESPYFPSEKYRAGLQKLYEVIASFVPQKVWEDFEAKKQEYQSKQR